MTSKLGREWPALTTEDRLDALRDHALGQELLIQVLLEAVERLGVRFDWGDEPEPAVGPDATGT